MFALSISSVLIVCVLLFVFRRNVTTINQIAPDIIDHSLRSVAAGAEYLEDLTLVNISEQELELQVRAKAISEALTQSPAIDIRSLHSRVRGNSTSNS